MAAGRQCDCHVTAGKLRKRDKTWTDSAAAKSHLLGLDTPQSESTGGFQEKSLTMLWSEVTPDIRRAENFETMDYKMRVLPCVFIPLFCAGHLNENSVWKIKFEF